MKHVLTIIFVALFSICATAQSSRRDSLLNTGRAFRDSRMFAEAITLFLEAGGDAGRLEIAQTRFETGEFHKALEICDALIKNESIYSEDAKLIEARIRDAQGLHRIANSKYRKLVNAGNGKAAYYYALMKHRTGHNIEAVALLQRAISINKANINAHIVLSEIMVDNGQRYLAILPIMYTLLLSSDAETIRDYQSQLESLLSAKSHLLHRLFSNDLPYVSDNTLLVENKLSSWIEGSDCPSDISHILCIMPSLLNYMKEKQTDNIDWWQIMYADFFTTLCDAGHQDALLHHLCSSLRPEETKQWIESHEGQYADFLTWLSFQR